MGMVEAEGVEPSSGKAHRKKNYMLVPFSFDSPGLISNGQESSPASPIDLAGRLRTESGAASPLE